jgi:hypothetical protein
VLNLLIIKKPVARLNAVITFSCAMEMLRF